MRFASLQKAILSQWEAGAGLVPGGGLMARLPRLIGSRPCTGSAAGADDIHGDLAERYGYVNRSLPDAELDAFVDALATRIASFDKQAITETKRLADVASLPSDAEIAPGVGCLHRLAKSPGEPDEDQIVDGAWLPSTRGCRNSARISRRPVRLLINTRTSQAKREGSSYRIRKVRAGFGGNGLIEPSGLRDPHQHVRGIEPDHH